MGKKLLLIMVSFSLVLMLAAMPFVTACEEEAPESIKIAAVRSITGPLSIFEETAGGPAYKFWEYEVNEVRGGIYVAEYGKKLPVEIVVRDDTSDMDTMTTLLEEMLATGDYHFAYGPCCTPFLQAAGVICSEYEVVLIGAEGGATTIGEQLDLAPYMFATLNYSNWNQVYELCKLMDDWQEYHAPDPITVYVIYIDDLHGWEYSAAFREEAAKYDNIDIIKEVAVEPYAADIGEQLLDAQAMGADVFCSFTYPPTSFVTTGQAMAMGINFNAVVVGPGCCFEAYYEPAADGFGEAANGVCGFGAWNEHSSTALADYAQRQIDFFGTRLAMDWWGHVYYYAGLHCLEQAIVEAGTLDSAAVREVLATMKLQTILGETWFTDAEGNWPLGNTGGLLAIGCHTGEIGQWQYNVHGDGQWIFEVIDIGPHNTAPAIYPKPNWPGT